MCGFYQFFLFAGVLVLIYNNEIFSFYKFLFSWASEMKFDFWLNLLLDYL